MTDDIDALLMREVVEQAREEGLVAIAEGLVATLVGGFVFGATLGASIVGLAWWLW